MNNYPINRTDFNLVKGVTTEILFFIKNIDRKIVVLEEGTPHVVVQNVHDQTIMLDVPLSIYDINRGLWQMRVLKTDVQDWELGFYRYSVVVNRDQGDQVMLYTDRAYGPYSNLRLLDGPYPDPIEATTVPREEFTYKADSKLYSGAFPGAAKVRNLSGLHSAVFNYNPEFMGTITVQASLEDQPSQDAVDWFDVQSMTFETPNSDSPYLMQFTGNFLWVRFVVTELDPHSTGKFQSVVYRNT